MWWTDCCSQQLAPSLYDPINFHMTHLEHSEEEYVSPSCWIWLAQGCEWMWLCGWSGALAFLPSLMSVAYWRLLYLQLGSLNDNTCSLSWAQHTHSLPKSPWEKYVWFQAPVIFGYLLLQWMLINTSCIYFLQLNLAHSTWQTASL